jgi:hypothetical protein
MGATVVVAERVVVVGWVSGAEGHLALSGEEKGEEHRDEGREER